MSNYPDVDLPDEPDAERDARNDEDPRAAYCARHNTVEEIEARFARGHEEAVRAAREAFELIYVVASKHRAYTTADMELMGPTLVRLKELANA